MQKHFMTTCDGSLWDMRVKPLGALVRENYSCHHVSIESVADYKASIRAGAFAWPGGYPLYFICDDGGSLCFKCAGKEAREIMPAITHKQRDGWRIVACDVNYEDGALYCDHCNARIESAYAEPEDVT